MNTHAVKVVAVSRTNRAARTRRGNDGLTHLERERRGAAYMKSATAPLTDDEKRAIAAAQRRAA